MVSVSFIIPTIGRPSLARAIKSLVQQVDEKDEIIVVGDGAQPQAQVLCSTFSNSRVLYSEHKQTRQYGHAQRNFGIAAARSDYIAFLDDDDFYLPGSVSALKKSASENPGKVLMFRCRCYGKIIWEKKVITYGNVATLMIVLPNIKERIGVWKLNKKDRRGRGGDFFFITETISKWPVNSLVWDERVLAHAPKKGLGVLS